MNTDIYKIDNAKLICRLLPFFVRGRKMILFLEAAASPLVSLHNKFLSWAYETIVDVHATFQEQLFVWYLNHKFRKHFIDDNDSFYVSQSQEGDGLVVFNTDEHEMMGLFSSRIFNNEQSDLINQLYDIDNLKEYSKPMLTPQDRYYVGVITIYAPKINTSSDYTNSDYVKDVIEFVKNYKTSFGKINIIIKE